MRVLVACEFSGRIRNAFAAKGHDAWSCDLLPTESPGQHIEGDVLEILNDGWDLMIGHPPCQYLCRAGSGNWTRFPEKHEAAKTFFLQLYHAPVEKVAIENPVGRMSTVFRKPDQYIQPFEYGHPWTKKTCLWLRGLPTLKPTNIVETPTGWRGSFTHRIPKGPDRGKKRAVTFQGWADAMADQWG